MKRLPIRGYEGLYEVSDKGDIYSLRFDKIKKLSPRINKQGYVSVNLFKNRKTTSYLVHRLVMISFYPDFDHRNFVVDHINNIKWDNRLSNLAWLTSGDNNRKKTLDGTQIQGEKSHFSKLTEEHVLEIRRLAKNTSYTILSEKFGVSKATIFSVVNFRTWTHLKKEEEMKTKKKTKKSKTSKK